MVTKPRLVIRDGIVPALPWTGSGSPIERREHPRLWVSRETLPGLHAKLSGEYRAEFQNHVRDIDNLWGRIGVVGSTLKEQETYLRSCGFFYALGALGFGNVPGITYLHTREEYGRKYIDGARALNDALSVFHYDWCNDLLTDAEKTALALQHSKAKLPEAGSNPLDNNENYTWASSIQVALAYMNDGLIDEHCVTRLNQAFSIMDGDYLGLQKFVGSDGGWSQQLSYAVHGPIEALMGALESYRTANNVTRDELFASQTWLRYFPQWWAAHIVPGGYDGGTKDYGFIPDHWRRSMHRQNVLDPYQPPHFGYIRAILTAHRGVYADIDPQMASLSAWLLKERTGQLASAGLDASRKAVLSHFVLGRKDVAPRSPADLNNPRVMHFRGLGWVVIRPNTHGVQDSMVTYTARPFSAAAGSYSPVHNGSFTVFGFGGPILPHSGITVHHGYSNATRSAQCVVFPSADRAMVATNSPDKFDEGEQRYYGFPEVKSLSLYKKGAYHDMGGIAALEESATHVYIRSDLTRAYNSTVVTDRLNTAKIQSYIREFVDIVPGADGRLIQIIRDRIVLTDEKYGPRVLLHPASTAPVVTSKSGVPYSELETFVREGEWHYTDADGWNAQNTAQGAASHLFVTPLLPKAFTLTKIGGIGHEYENSYGVNQPYAQGTNPKQFTGTYRIETRAAVPALTHTFLHVVESVRVGATKSAVSLIDASEATTVIQIGSLRVTLTPTTANVT